MNKLTKWFAVSVLSFALLIPGLAHADDMKPMGSGMGTEMNMTMGTGENTDMMMMDGMAYLPLRLLAETLGYEVIWNGDDMSITLNFKGMGMMADKSAGDAMHEMYSVKIRIGSTQMMIGMDNKMLANAPVVLDNKAYVTKEFIAAYLLVPFSIKSM